jgi:hypothetical protein
LSEERKKSSISFFLKKNQKGKHLRIWKFYKKKKKKILQSAVLISQSVSSIYHLDFKFLPIESTLTTHSGSEHKFEVSKKKKRVYRVRLESSHSFFFLFFFFYLFIFHPFLNYGLLKFYFHLMSVNDKSDLEQFFFLVISFEEITQRGSEATQTHFAPIFMTV